MNTSPLPSPDWRGGAYCKGYTQSMKRKLPALDSTTDAVYLVNDVYPWARPKTLKGILPCAKSTGCLIPISFAIGINSTYNFHE